MYAMLGDVPAEVRNTLWPEDSIDQSYARWSSGWTVDIGQRRQPAGIFSGQPIIGRLSGWEVQPFVWDGWCLIHVGVIPLPERLWIGRVPNPSWALLKRLAWVGSHRAHERAVRETVALLGEATSGPHSALAGDPQGRIYAIRIHGLAARAAVIHRLDGPGWAVVSTGPLEGGQAVETGVTPLRESALEEREGTTAGETA
jgi:hypothetical protein